MQTKAKKRRMWLYFFLTGIFMFIYLQHDSPVRIGFIYEFALMLAGACLAFAINLLISINRRNQP